ncbi:nucleolar pre-ribosomal-associated protein 1-like [Amphiura filiformis]|uniref:nucleolar pre-ribosomal-associated protein 1-like n=1 Tax=Amphiura filiformis TaxID=82378 RepID=UPI003B2199B0
MAELQFSSDEFRKQLNEGAEAFTALKNFLIYCHKYEDDSSEQDVVREYLQMSPQCAEILSLLDAEKRPPSENKQIFDVITQILLRITDDLPHHATTAVHIVNLLLRAHIRHIYRALNSSNTAKIIMSALKLLAAMVTHSTATAKEVMALFRMDHEGLLLLLNRTDKKVQEDVRVCMVRFLMAFLITKDSHIIEQLLTHRELMKTILKGLRQDRMSTLHLIIPTMQQYIVCNSSVSKTQKLKLFNDYTLPQIASLYDWQGVNDMEAADDGKAVVRQLVHGFLLEVTCNLKHGINFHDKTMGTSGKSNNAALLKFALKKKTVNRDSLVEELVTKILQTCPDVLAAYLSKSSLSFAPRNSVVWQKNMAIIMKVYSSIQVSAIVTNIRESPSSTKMVSMAMVATVPAFLTQTMITQGLKQGGNVALTLLESILVVLIQAQKITDAFNKWNSPDRQDLTSSYHAAIQRVLPDVNTLLPTWQRALGKWKEELAGSSKQETDENQNKLPPPSNLHILSKLMEVLCAYQQVLPSSVEETSHDFTLMVHSVFGRFKGNENVLKGEGEVSSSADLLQLQCHCLRFLTGFPAGRFRWFKEVRGEGTVMFRLLSELIASHDQPELHEHITKLVEKILLETCLFEHSPSEVTLWLQNIMTLDPSKRPEVVKFLQSCLTKTIRNPHPYNDKVADCVAEGQSSRQQSIQRDTAATKAFSIGGIPEVHDINIEPTMETECMESTESESDWRTLWPDPTLPCSALLPVALERFTQETSIQSSEAISAYISNVTTTILHQQVDPLPLCLLVQQYAEIEGKPANEKWKMMLRYTGKWLEEKRKKSPKKHPSDVHVKKLLKESATTLSTLLQACFECGPQALLNEDIWSGVMEKVAQLSKEQVVPVIRHILLYLHTLLDMPNKSKMRSGTLTAVVHKYMTLILTVINHTIKLKTEVSAHDQDSKGIISLLIPKGSDPTLQKLATILLTHPMCLYWYQWSEQRNTPCPVEEPDEIAVIITGYVLKFLSKLQGEVTVEDLGKYINPYAVMTFFDLKKAVDAYDRLSPLGVDESQVGTEEESKRKSDTQHESKNDDDDDDSIDTVSSFDQDLFDAWASDVKIFTCLSTFAKQSNISDIICRYLKQPKLLVPDVRTNSKDANSTTDSKDVNLFTRVICALASNCKTEPRIGGLLAELLKSTGCEEFGRALQSMMLYNSKEEVLFTTKEMLCELLNNPTEVRAKVAAWLIEYSFAQKCNFESWCLTKEGQRSLTENKVVLLHVVRKYAEMENTSKSTGVATLNQIWDVYWPWLSEQFVTDKMEDKDNFRSSGVQVRMKIMFSYLFRMHKTTTKVVVGLLRRILTNCLEHGTIFYGLFHLSCITQLYPNDEVIFLALQLQQMTTLCKLEIKKPWMMEQLVERVHSRWRRTKDTISLSSCPEFPQIWKDFIRYVLKDEYDRHLFLNLLGSLVIKLYDNPQKAKKLFSLERLYQMIVSHSKFLPTMLTEESEGEEAALSVKPCLSRLLLIIAELEPSCCQTAHFAVFLGAYSASLSDCDRRLLALMNVYEKNNAVMWDYRPYMWGPVAITQHASRKALGQNLWQQPTMREVLELLDPVRLHKSALNFPLDKNLMEYGDDDDTWYVREMAKCYDPSFLLPLFSHLLTPEAVVDCKKFAECHALEYTIAALGSHNAQMRTAAYHVLAAYHQHLMGARLMGKRELMYIIECLRNSITEPNCRLPNIVALFVGRLANVMMSPAHHIYPVLVQFLTIKPKIQMTAVPMFYRLFYSANLQHGKERDWLLQLLQDGFRDAEDFQVYDKTGIFKTLLAFQLSVLCAEPLNNQIFDLLGKACAIPEAAYQLVRQHSLLTWIDAHINTDSDTAIIESIVTLLGTLTMSIFTSESPISDILQSKKTKTVTNPETVATNGEDGTDVQDTEKGHGRGKLPPGSCQLVFSICMRLLDWFTKMAVVKPAILRVYLETLSRACRYQKNLTTDPKLSSHAHQQGIPLRAHHIRQLLFVLARVLRKKQLLEDLTSVARDASTMTEAGSKMKGTNGENDGALDYVYQRGGHLYERCHQATVSIVTCWRPFSDRTEYSQCKDGSYEGNGSARTEGKKAHQGALDVTKEGGKSRQANRVIDESCPMEIDQIKAGSKLRTSGEVSSGDHINDRAIDTRANSEADKHKTDKLVSSNNQFVMLTIKWILTTLGEVTMTDDDKKDSLQFVKEIVDNNATIQQRLIEADEEMSREVVRMLLALYTSGRFHRSLKVSEKHIVNQIFLKLVSWIEHEPNLVSSSEQKRSGLEQAVKTVYKEPLRMCRELVHEEDGGISNSVSCQLTSLLMRELWAGSPAPTHFLDAWDHCVKGQRPDTNVEKKTKRPAEGENVRSGKKKRKTRNRRSIERVQADS